MSIRMAIMVVEPTSVQRNLPATATEFQPDVKFIMVHPKLYQSTASPFTSAAAALINLIVDGACKRSQIQNAWHSIMRFEGLSSAALANLLPMASVHLAAMA